MIGLLNSLLPLGLFALATLPLLAAAVVRSQALLKIVFSYTFAVSGVIALAQSTLLAPAVPIWVTQEAMFSEEAEAQRCTEVLATFARLGLFAEPPRPGRLVVVGGLWERLPAEVQNVVQLCSTHDGIPAEVTVAADE